MARKNNIIGLASVKFGPVGSDGGMGATLTEMLGATVKGSASLVLNEGSEEELEIEETEAAYDILETSAPKWAFQLESYNVSAKALSELGGGTYAAGASGAPDSIGIDIPEAMEVSTSAETKNGAEIEIARMRIRLFPQFDFKKEAFGRVIVRGTPLKPTKEGVPTIKKTDAPA